VPLAQLKTEHLGGRGGRGGGLEGQTTEELRGESGEGLLLLKTEDLRGGGVEERVLREELPGDDQALNLDEGGVSRSGGGGGLQLMTEDLARDDEALNLEANGTQFTRFTGTKGRKTDAESAGWFDADCIHCRTARAEGTQFTCFTSTKVQMLTPEELQDAEDTTCRRSKSTTIRVRFSSTCTR
jgi:hypothetical protein